MSRTSVKRVCPVQQVANTATTHGIDAIADPRYLDQLGLSRTQGLAVANGIRAYFDGVRRNRTVWEVMFDVMDTDLFRTWDPYNRGTFVSHLAHTMKAYGHTDLPNVVVHIASPDDVLLLDSEGAFYPRGGNSSPKGYVTTLHVKALNDSNPFFQISYPFASHLASDLPPEQRIERMFSIKKWQAVEGFNEAGAVSALDTVRHNILYSLKGLEENAGISERLREFVGYLIGQFESFDIGKQLTLESPTPSPMN